MVKGGFGLNHASVLSMPCYFTYVAHTTELQLNNFVHQVGKALAHWNSRHSAAAPPKPVVLSALNKPRQELSTMVQQSIASLFLLMSRKTLVMMW